MRISSLSIGLLALLTPLAAAWSKEDREIFRVRDELLTHEGPEITFYEFLGVTPSATIDDINKAYRKKSRSLHPDKVKQQLAAERVAAQKKKAKEQGAKPGVKVSKPPSQSEVRAAVKRAGERQARLSIVANILRGPERDRYDHFLSNGFPTWKGTEYYYSRYRPGLGTVLFGVFLFAGGAAHYIALYMGWKRQREFVERYIKFARDAAWGGGGFGIPGLDAQQQQQQQQDDDDEAQVMAGPINRRMRRMQERGAKKEAAKDGGRKVRRAATAARAAAPASGSATPPAGAGPQGAKKRVVAENGKVLVVDSLGDVYLEQEDEDGNMAEFLLDPNEIPRPTFSDTAVVRLPLWAYNLSIGRLLNKDSTSSSAADASAPSAPDAADSDSDGSSPGKRTPSSESADDSFEMLEKSVGELGDDKAMATGASGSQKQGGGSKAGKRKGKKR